MGRMAEEEEETAAPPGTYKDGQKFPTPPNGDGTRAFYNTLLDENNTSLIAIKYCIEYGVLIGTQYHSVLSRYKQMKDAGAFKRAAGGIQSEYMKTSLRPGVGGKTKKIKDSK
eukprot:GHVR01007050.1.p1 GENE.GHVR01007050.1~~GHVR01007050.1.p1  ORF type:complete len:113 (+),score=21.18 GHVR01007050.1:26-364(+)